MNALLPLLLAATIPLRNPFWPIGHVGDREVISAEPRITIAAPVEKAAETAAEDVETSVTPETIAAAEAAEAANRMSRTDRLWIAARKSLAIGGTMKVGSRQAVTINGRIYADGDLVSTNCDGNRFTWRVCGLTESGSLRLKRLRIKEIDNEKGTNP